MPFSPKGFLSLALSLHSHRNHYSQGNSHCFLGSVIASRLSDLSVPALAYPFSFPDHFFPLFPHHSTAGWCLLLEHSLVISFNAIS